MLMMIIILRASASFIFDFSYEKVKSQKLMFTLTLFWLADSEITLRIIEIKQLCESKIVSIENISN